ncbi:MAG: 50S ribosomal protein L21 [Syntrophales bacterium]|nr:50S ribosomal protein L21 [Syntrophales bacterium]MDD5232838.1 50S ribosomal protein L21 [Syntrophales bacterium]MDD5531862.1 50S ribosomal protein L21 [Syntrophales bacterium]HPL63665.1 50S ribosomal protein L21 [Syntrophales bacterium]
MYAVIKTGGKQYRVSEGDRIEIEKIDGDSGSDVVFNEVLMVSRGEEIRVGTPLIAGAKVIGEIVLQGKGPKITIFKMKRRKGFRKKTGHRQDLTSLKIKEITLS